MVSYKMLLSFLWKFVCRQKWLFFFILLLDCVTWPLDSLLWPYFLRWVVDIFTRYEETRALAWAPLKSLIVWGISFALFIEIASRIMGFLMARAIPKMQADVRLTMFDHIQQHSPRYFNERFAGALANKITDMTHQIDVIAQQLFWPIIPACIVSFAGALILWFIHPIFAFFLIFWVVIQLWVVLKFTRPVDQYEQHHGETRSALLGKIVDSFTNNFAINLFYRFKFEKESLLPFQKVEEKSNIEAKSFAEKMNCYSSFFFLVGNFLLINGTLLYLWLHNKISTGQAVQVFNTVWNISSIMWVITRSFPLIFQSLGLAKQAYSAMVDPIDLGDQPNATPLQINKGEIIFDNVSFYYGKKKLFENKQVHIKGGEKVGLVGFTGAGKSTFINLILRFYPVHKGKILIDGQEISQVTLESLRQKIALIPQDPILFHRTLRENIAYGKPGASEEEVLRAAKLAHCDEFIRRMPEGYDSKVGERGTKLSGGEKQRIAIARATLVDAPILILDEATSSLDSMTERYIQQSMETLMENRTTIIIAHRLSTLSRMDRILVFDKGKIIEEGTHHVLMAKGGLYYKLWRMQVGGFLPDEPTIS